jgi:exopolyphosphatase / guanosine-5'-triphosphate,3'-diphosphate pyrophosphatase
MILAGIDIGTNSIRLLIAETGPDVFRELYSTRRTTRLGKDLDRTGRLSPDAIERSFSVLSEFSAHICRFSACQTSAIGTSALRIASNANEFITEVHRRTGIAVTVIRGEEEARLTLLGVTSALRGREGFETGLPTSALVMDIGGGSTEFILTNTCSGPLVQSLPLGAVYLAERCITTDPPSLDELTVLRQTIRMELDKAEKRWPSLSQGTGNRPEKLVGTAGTITTLAAMDQGMVSFDPARINGAILTRVALDRIVETMVRSTLSERHTLAGLEPGREDIILPGAIITQEIMERHAYKEMLISDGGLREGIVADLAVKQSQTPAIKEK